MASKEADEKYSNTKTGEETIALEKKRSKSRRVSFAETTAIHLFDRDEECDTPPLPTDADHLSNGRLQRSESDEIRELLASDDNNSDDDDDENAVDTSFLRPFESPSPGSFFGSATSNHEDTFFGPVSAGFIKPGRLSGSAASDENHVVLDSTGFSMHYRSLAMSDFGGEFTSPTRVRLAFGERTCGQISTCTNGEDYMTMTASGKQVSGSSSLSATVNGSGNSDDMSVVGENLHRYDYGELPPELDVLLAEEGKDLGSVPLTSHVEPPNSVNSFKGDAGSGLHQNGFERLDIDNRDIDADHVSDVKEISNGATSAAHVNIDNGNDSIPHAILNETTHNTSMNMDDGLFPVVLSDSQTKTPLLPTNVVPVDKDEEARRGAGEASGNFQSPLSSFQSKFNDEQPIAGSVFSSLAKHRQIYSVTPNDRLKLIESEKKFCHKGSKHVLSASSIEKGVSRLKRLEAFPFVSASKAEGNASRLMPPKPLTSSLIKNSGNEDILINHLLAPVACLDKQFSNVDGNEGKFQSMDKVSRYDMRTLGDVQYATSCSHDKSIKFTGISVSPLALPKGNRREPCISRGNIKETLQSSGGDSSASEITFNDLNYSRGTGMLDNTAFSPETSAQRKVSASPLYQGSLSENVKQQAESSLKRDWDVRQKKADNSKFSSSVPIERKEEAKRSSSNIKLSKTVSQEMQSDESMLGKYDGYPIIPMFFQAPLMDKASESSKIIIPSANIGTGNMSSKTFLVQNMTSVSESPKQELSCSLLEKNSCHLKDDANMHLLVGNKVLTPRYQLNSKHDEDNGLLLTLSNIYGSHSSSSPKRKLFDKAEDDDDDTTSFQHKQKLYKVQKHYKGDRKIPHSIGSDVAARDWADVFTSVCGMTKLLPSLTDKLDLSQIRRLNAIFVHLDKSRSYELHLDLCSLEVFNSASFPQIKRLADTKLLLYKLLYKKAKLRLMHLERDKLRDQVQQLDSRIEESKMLTSSCQGSCIRGQTDVEIDVFQPKSCPIDDSETALVAAEFSSLRKELEVSERKLSNLNKSFHAYTKFMKEPTCIEINVLVKNLLKKRVACRSLQSEFQLCQVGNVKAMDGKSNILFDHAGMMSQRFIVKSNSTYGLVTLNTLNNVKISKMFPGVDAYTAFSFVFCGEASSTYAGVRTIAQETQKCSSCLHSVLDVVEEVELAMIELRNLSDARILQPSAGKLDLRLCFTDFNSCATVALSIDITCLARGIYPLEVLPYEVQGRATRGDKSFELLLDNIKSVVYGVRCGYMRIISMCRCVSKMIQAHCMS